MNPFDLAERFSGIREVGGSVDNPQIMAMLRLDNKWPTGDEVPWCSAFVSYICWLLRLPRSTSLRARSWLTVGVPVSMTDARKGDIVILTRGKGDQPGPEVLDAPGHVGFYAGLTDQFVEVLGGNQSDTVKVSRYPQKTILGIRRVQ